MLDSLRKYKAGVFQALGHPNRVAIVELLNLTEMSVNQLCEKVGIEQSNASQHLAVLRNNHIVQTRKEGNQIYYSLSDPVFGQLLEALRSFFLSHMTEALELLRQEEHSAAHATKANKDAPERAARR